VNLREGTLEVMRDPDRAEARFRDTRTIRGDERIELAALPGASVAVADLLPSPR
jgi:hypothetical protein